MPNWCYNRVSIYSEDTKQIDELFDIFNNPEPFNKLIPSPVWSKTPNEDGELPVLDEHKLMLSNVNKNLKSHSIPHGVHQKIFVEQLETNILIYQ